MTEEISPHHSRSLNIKFVVINEDDLRQLISIVHTHVCEAAEVHIRRIKRDSFADEAEYTNMISEVRESYAVGMRIVDDDDNEISMNDITAFRMSNMPVRVKSLYLASHLGFKDRFGFFPNNYIELLLDFSKPMIAIDFLTLPSNPTVNVSQALIRGFDELWVRATYDKLKQFFDERKVNRRFLHSSGSYDLILYIFGLPIIIWIIYRIEESADVLTRTESHIIAIAIYAYVFLILAVGARLLFLYARWAFPVVEFSRSGWGPARHRKLWSALLVTIVITVVIDFLYFLFRF